MITDDLFKKVLLEPASEGATTLYVVSGYASPALVYRHLVTKKNINVKLIIGMASWDGMRLGSHNTYKKIATDDFPGRFSCNYYIAQPPVHSALRRDSLQWRWRGRKAFG